MWSIKPLWSLRGLTALSNIKTEGRAASAVASAGKKLGLGHVNSMIKAHLFFSGLTLAFGQGSPSQRIRDVAVGTFWMWSTLGMNSGWRQALWGVGIMAAPHAEGIARGLIGAYRKGIDAQTSAAIPFSHSNLNMSQAYATLSFARQRMSEAYGHIGSEASFMAARYMNRG